ncbi:MAG: hypothetical protein LC104_15225 [Bacteroidales bacterium]|nr:hypothetical protein [Bacteroidales bacterium]
MEGTDIAQSLAAAVGQTLPTEYLAFLDGLSVRPTLGPSYGPILNFAGRRWRPYSRTRLAETVPHHRRESAFPYAHETARYIELLRVADAQRDDQASAILDEGFSLDRLARGFCVGDDGNGELLFVDPETGGVYAYYHDGMDVERWAGSLTELVAGSRDWLGDEDAEQGDAVDQSTRPDEQRS